MSPGVAAMVLIAYYLVSIEIYLATTSLGLFRMSFLWTGPDRAADTARRGRRRPVLVTDADYVGHRMTLFDLGGIIASAGLGVTFVASVVRNAKTLFHAEPLLRGCS
jgi:hypothetical protein